MPLPRVGDTLKGDVGCEYAPACLSCPLPDCYEALDTPGRIALARAFGRGGLQEAQTTMQTILKGAWTPRNAGAKQKPG